MSATDALAASSAPSTPTGQRPTWLEILKLAGTLLWRHWPALLFWFLAQHVSYFLLMEVAIVVGVHSALLSFVAIAVLVVTQLICVIGMFMAVRPSLNLPAKVAGTGSSGQPWFNALTVALLPFFAYYAAWGLLEGIRRDFIMQFFTNNSLLMDGDRVYANPETPVHLLSLKGLWLALLVAWAVRAFAKRRLAATGRSAWSLLATVCEAYWVFVGVAVIGKGFAMVTTWLQTRVAYVAVAEWWQNPFLGMISLAPLKRVLDPLLGALADLAAAVSMPLVWLAITALIYGMDLRRRQRLDRADARLRHAARRYGKLHFGWQLLADKLSAGWNSKGVPLLNSVRLVLRAGLPALLVLCLLWQLLAFIDANGWIWILDAAGARSWPQWSLTITPYALLFTSPSGVRGGLFTEILRTVLLAATFSCAMQQLRATAAIRPE